MQFLHTTSGLTTHTVTKTQVTPANKEKSIYNTPSLAYVTPNIHKNKWSLPNQHRVWVLISDKNWSHGCQHALKSDFEVSL